MSRPRLRSAGAAETWRSAADLTNRTWRINFTSPMPQLGDYRWIVNNVGFLYRTPEQAARGQAAGGTGFFVAVPSKKAPDRFHHHYLVTNIHVARGEPRT